MSGRVLILLLLSAIICGCQKENISNSAELLKKDNVLIAADVSVHEILKTNDSVEKQIYSGDEYALEDQEKIEVEELPETVTEWYRPSIGVTWQWQLQGNINTAYQAEIYDVDLFETSAETIQSIHEKGIKVICYFSAGSYESYRDDKGQFLASVLGNTLDGWADEKWVDIRSSNVKSIMSARLDLAKEKGCDGVEPDNIDGYSKKTGFNFTAEELLVYNKYLAEAAHERGLSIGLKNNLKQVNDLVDYYDFAVNEKCFEYDECSELAPFINNGKPVLNAEYAVNFREILCSDSILLQFSTLILPWDLDDGVWDSCL